MKRTGGRLAKGSPNATAAGIIAAMEHMVAFMPSGRRIAVPAGTDVLTAARLGGVDLDSACGGRGICGRCAVNIGEDPGPLTAVELRYAEKRGLPAGRRLGCCVRVERALTVDVPPESTVHRPSVRKSPDERPVCVDPPLRLYSVHLPEPDLHDQSGEAERLEQALHERTGTQVRIDALQVLRQLAAAVQAEGREVTAAVYEGRVKAVFPGFVETVYGLAVDIGSTTLAVQLCDLRSGAVIADAGAMNPQIRFGEDVMSRVSYAQMNASGAADMTAAVRAGLRALIDEVICKAQVPRERVLHASIVGNPIMHHLFLGLDPVPLGTAPFTPLCAGAQTVRAGDFELNLPAEAPVYLPPLIAGHVGSDAAAVMLALAPFDADEIVLIADVGTNAEIIVGNRERLLAASSPTGPALEGAQISCGRRAAPGAVERIRIGADGRAALQTIDDLPASGLCGSAIIEMLPELYAAGLMRGDGRLIEGPGTEADGRTFRYRINPELTFSQTDVRAVQLAKAALYAGCMLLLERLGLQQPDKIILAGAFGSYIDPEYAVRLGLVPPSPSITSAGNAAGTGARMLLVNAGLRAVLDEQVRRTEKIETALEPRFQQLFIDAMAMPGSAGEAPPPERRRRRPPSE